MELGLALRSGNLALFVVALLVVVLRVVVMVVVAVVAILGLLEVTRASSVLTSSSPTPLQRSEVQRQAEMSASREVGEHWAWGWTGLSMLPSRTLVGKHSRMTELSVADFLQA